MLIALAGQRASEFSNRGEAFQRRLAARAASRRSNCKGPPGLPCAVTPQGTWPPRLPSNPHESITMLTAGVCPVVYRPLPSVLLTSQLWGIGRLFFGWADRLLPTWEAPDGHSIDRFTRSIFAWWRWLGIFPLAQELALGSCRQESRRAGHPAKQLCCVTFSLGLLRAAEFSGVIGFAQW